MGKSVQDLLRPIGKLPLCSLQVCLRYCGVRRPDDNGKAELGRLKRRGDDVPLHLDELGLRDLRLRVRLEVPVRVLLRGRHLLQPLLIAFQHLHLIGDDYLSTDYDRKAQRGEVLQHARKGGVRQLLQADHRIEIPVDVEVGLGFVQNACLRCLLPRAAILKHLLA